MGRNGSRADTFERVVEEAFGRYFYGLFFRDYTAKVLGVDPSLISGDWARRRVPMPGRRYMVQWLFPWWRPGRAEHSHDPFSVVQVTGSRGMDSLFDGILAKCGDSVEVRTGTSLCGLDIRDGAVRGAALRYPDGSVERLDTDRVVATLPLPDLVACLEPSADPDMLHASRSLRYRGIVFVFLVMSRGRLLDSNWAYFQDAGLPFNRVSEFGSVVPGIYGADRTVVCAEVTADPGEHPWDGPDSQVVQGVMDGLATVTGQDPRESLIRAHVVRERHAYPNWLAGYRGHRDLILERLDAIRGLAVVGRQARFDYLNMDECADAAFRAMARMDKARDGA
jgi:protoporphyrinogen oxidase